MEKVRLTFLSSSLMNDLNDRSGRHLDYRERQFPNENWFLLLKVKGSNPRYRNIFFILLSRLYLGSNPRYLNRSFIA